MEFIDNQVRNVTSRDEGEKILGGMKEIADLYDFATISDLKYACGIEGNYTDDLYGWNRYDLNSACIARVVSHNYPENKWVVIFPKARSMRDPKPAITRVSYRKYYDPKPKSKPEAKPVYITINTSDLENLGDTLGSVFEYVNSITNREVHITIN